MTARHTSTAVLIVVLLFPLSSFAVDFSGQVVGVSDGDTISVMHEERLQKIRLRGVDCPENGQAFSKSAKRFASELAFGREVTIRPFGMDKYGRTVGSVSLPDRRSLNEELVKAGMCGWFRKIRAYTACSRTV